MRQHLKMSIWRPKRAIPWLSGKGCGLILAGLVGVLMTSCLATQIFDIYVPFESASVATVGGVRIEYQTYQSLKRFWVLHDSHDKTVLRMFDQSFTVWRLRKPHCVFVPEAEAIVFAERGENDSIIVVAVEVSTSKIHRFPIGKKSFNYTIRNAIAGGATNAKLVANKSSIELWERDGLLWHGARFNLLTDTWESLPVSAVSPESPR